jgi:hypothetical protein
MPSGIAAGVGLSKDEVNYRHHEKCSTCTHFYPQNSCEIVSGNISPDAVCNKWEIKPRDNEGKDAEFYRAEYSKVNK